MGIASLHPSYVRLRQSARRSRLNILPLKGGGRRRRRREGVNLSAYESAQETPTPTLPLSGGGSDRAGAKEEGGHQTPLSPSIESQSAAARKLIADSRSRQCPSRFTTRRNRLAASGSALCSTPRSFPSRR